MCNPYGVRVGDHDGLDALYSDLGAMVKTKASGWDAWILSGNANVGALRMKASRRIPISNGGIDCPLAPLPGALSISAPARLSWCG